MKKTGFLLFMVAAMASNVFAADPSIYTWGYGEIFYKVLQAVTIISRESYLITSALAVGGLLLMIKNTASGAGSSDMAVAMGKYLFITTIIIGLFSTQTKQYIVEDEITGQAFPIDNVPIGIGETFSLFTSLEKNLAKAFEIAFATPNSISYSKAGLGFTMSAPINLGSSYMVDAYIVRTFNEYMGNCVFSAITANEMSGDVLTMSTNLKNDLSVTGYLTPYYSAANPNGVDMQCQDAWDDLKVALGSKLDDMEQIAANKMMVDQTVFQNGMAETTRMMFGVSQNSQDYLFQQTLINMTNNGLKAVALATGGDASALAYAKALSETNQRQTWAVTGILAQQNLPLMKAVMTTLVLGIFILLVLLSIIYGDLGHIKMGFTLLFAMVLWTPLALLINGMFNIAIERILPNITNGGLTMVNLNDVSENLKNYLSFLGYLAASIPVFAYAIAKKSEHGFVSLFGGVGAASTSAAGGAASQTASGNISVGNSSLGKFSATDMYGTHDYLGKGSWRDTVVAKDGSLRTKTTNAEGKGVATSDTGGYGQVTMDVQSRDVTSVKDATITAGLVNDISASYGKTAQNLASVNDAFNSSFVNTLTKGKTAGGMEIDTNTFSDTNTWGHGTGEALTKVTQESITNSLKQMTSNGHKFNFSSDHSANAGGNANLTIGSPDGVSLFTGMSVKGSASVGYTVTGKTADGKDFSTTITGDEAKTFGNTFSKNLTSSINENEGLSLGLAKQAQKTGGFNDSDTLAKADNYVKAWSDSESITKLYNMTAREGVAVTHDLLPNAINSYIAANPELAAMKKASVPGAQDASDIALRQIRDVEYADEAKRAFEAASGKKLDMSEVKRVPMVIDEAETKMKNQNEQYRAKSTNVENKVEAVLPEVIENTSRVPKNQSDMANVNNGITKRYHQAHEEKKAAANGDMQHFTQQNKVATKDEIVDGKAKIEANFYRAKDEVGVWGTLKQNPILDGTAKAMGLEGEFDKMINKIENKDYEKIDATHDKAQKEGLVGTKLPASSAADTRINTEKLENFSTQELKDLQTFEKMHPKRNEMNDTAERQLEQAIQHRENQALQDKVQKAEKSVKTISKVVAEMKQNEQ